MSNDGTKLLIQVTSWGVNINTVYATTSPTQLALITLDGQPLGDTPPGTRFLIRFYADEAHLPLPAYDADQNAVTMYMSWKQYSGVVDLLANTIVKPEGVWALYRVDQGQAYADIHANLKTANPPA